MTETLLHPTQTPAIVQSMPAPKVLPPSQDLPPPRAQPHLRGRWRHHAPRLWRFLLRQAPAIIALLALGLAVYTALLERGHDRASVRPQLTFTLALSRQTLYENIGLYVENHGPGLALLDPLSIDFVPTTIEQQQRAQADALHTLGFAGLGRLLADTYADLPSPVVVGSLGALAPGQRVCLIGYPSAEITDSQLATLACVFHRLDVSAPYHSVYNERRHAEFRGSDWSMEAVFPCPE